MTSIHQRSEVSLDPDKDVFIILQLSFHNYDGTCSGRYGHLVPSQENKIR